MAKKHAGIAAVAAAAALTTQPAEDGAETLRPEAAEGLPIDVERLDVVNSGSATDAQRAELQACLTRLNSISFNATKDVFNIRQLLFGDGHMTT